MVAGEGSAWPMSHQGFTQPGQERAWSVKAKTYQVARYHPAGKREKQHQCRLPADTVAPKPEHDHVERKTINEDFCCQLGSHDSADCTIVASIDHSKNGCVYRSKIHHLVLSTRQRCPSQDGRMAPVDATDCVDERQIS